MNYETKELYVGTTTKQEETIKTRENFGWSFVEVTHHGRSRSPHVVLQRDKDMKNYDKIAELEDKYDSLQKKLKYYSPITNSPEMFLLILLFVFPFVIYCVYKHNQKQEYAANNARIHKQMDEVLLEAQSLLK